MRESNKACFHYILDSNKPQLLATPGPITGNSELKPIRQRAQEALMRALANYCLAEISPDSTRLMGWLNRDPQSARFQA